jgi:dCMP deaminase
MINKWDKYFLTMARHVSTMSKDPSSKVGCVIAGTDNRLISTGYNGLPKKILDRDEYLTNRDIKLKIILHAEENAFNFATRELDGYTVYTWPFQPCAHCTSLIIQNGIIKVVSLRVNLPRWQPDFDLSESLFKEAGVELVLIEPSEMEE